MLESIFTQNTPPTFAETAIAFGVALLCGFIIACAYRIGAKKVSKSMAVTLIILPAAVQSMIMLVNGSVGTGIAIVGAFSLVRFRSVPGNSRDICVLFMAMTAGVAAGVGYETYAVASAFAACVIMVIAEKLIPDGSDREARKLKILLPENMDYKGVFDEVLEEYASRHEQVSVRTVNMGTMYELTYIIKMKDPDKEKEMLDKIRCRNGNLTVSCGVMPERPEEI